MSYYGSSRLTGDIDVLYRCTLENAVRLYKALSIFWGTKPPGIDKPESLNIPNQVIQFGQPPNRIDLLTDISGVTFEDCVINRKIAHVEKGSKKFSFPVIGLEALTKNKETVGRGKDLADLDFLKKRKK